MVGEHRFTPNWVSAPGETILDILNYRKINNIEFAHQIGATYHQVDDLLKGECKINPELASRLAEVLGASKEFWLRREQQFQENRVRIYEEWIKSLPVADMVKQGWIERSKDLVRACLDFFGVPDLRAWREKYNDVLCKVAFRTSLSFQSEISAVTVWLRRGEIIGNQIKLERWNPSFFRDNLLKIRSLTKMKSPSDFLPKLIQLCADCGVALAVVRTPKGCAASGATRFLSPEKALMVLSFRHLTDDQFWFTFYHEAAHLLLHAPTRLLIEEVGGEIDITQEEEEANSFAAQMLLPHPYLDRLNTVRLYAKDIIRFAVEAGISPGIVVGQLQHLGRLDYNRLYSLKRKYDLDEINS